MSTLSTIAAFDDLRRNHAVLSDGIAEEEFLKFLQLQEECRKQWVQLLDNEKRLKIELESASKTMTDLESKLHHARKLLDIESKARRDAEHEREQLERRMTAVFDLLKNDREIKDETRSKFEQFNNFQKKRKSAHLLRVEEQLCNEINSTGSFLSDLSITQSEEDFLDCHSKVNKSYKKHRASSGVAHQIAMNKRKSRETRRSTHKTIEIQGSEKIVAHAKVTVPQGNGPILAESVVEAVPATSDEIMETENLAPKNSYTQKTPRKSPFQATSVMKTPSAPPLSELQTNVMQTPTLSRAKERRHEYSNKTVFKSELCTYCEKKIRFGCVALKCKNCRVSVHPDCADKLSMACIPASNTPQMQKGLGSISDFVTQFKPMIPALLIHCIDEIERRGLNEVGIYRISGAERDVRALKEKYLRSKAIPCLTNIDIHVICGCVKDFLRSLQDKLIPSNMWTEFSNAVQAAHPDQVIRSLKAAVGRLPEANRDTLAFMIQHLQRIAECPQIKMPLENLAKVFAPTLIDHSHPDLDPNQMYGETMIQVAIMTNLLNIPGSYWNQFTSTNIVGYSVTSSSEPERDTAHDANSNGSSGSGGVGQNPKYYVGGTPSLRSAKKERKYYATPPYPKNKNK
ncbi:rac GTPase-activating protein 1 [Culicoides brevitarsis]|uniref:rac GTPase-activating protein 1 n=1 Tax=Culicoides brevitarsis TaxID=469753 RepID=UPI00307C4113